MGHRFVEKRSSKPKMELLRLLFTVVAEGEVELHSKREADTYKDSDDQVNECKRYKF